jgi:DnaD/phage-associated family protein
MGTSAIKHALDALEKYKILVPTTVKPDPRKGQEYWLQDNEAVIDWDGLEQRITEKRDKSIRRTSHARTKNPTYKGLVGQDRSQVSCGTRVKGLVPQGSRVLSDKHTKPIETHPNPDLYIADPIAQKLSELKCRFNPNSANIIQAWKDTFPDEIILRAIQDAADRKKVSLPYIDQIIVSWQLNGIPPTREERAKNVRQNNTTNQPSTYKAPEYSAEEIAAIRLFKQQQADINV